jgi:hypothetical protein
MAIPYSPQVAQQVLRPQPAPVEPPLPTFGEEPELDFSYERDIAPLQQRFFRSVYGNRSIDPRDRASMASGFATQLGSAFEQQAKLRDLDAQRRNRELTYRAGLFSLEQAREKANRERTMLEALPKVTSELDAILADPAADPETQRVQLSRWGLQNSGLLSTNDAARTAYSAALSGISKPKPVITDEDLLRMGIPLDTLDTNKDGVVSEEERTPMRISGALGGMSQTRTLLEAQEKLDKQRQSLLDDALGGLTRVKFATQASDDPTAAPMEADEFGDAGMSVAVDSVIALLGSPADEKLAAESGPKKKFEIAKNLQAQYLRASTRPAATGPRSLLTAPTP